VSVDPVIPRLLAKQDRLSRIEKDEILDAVLASAAPAKQRMRWWFGVVPAVAAVLALLVIAPWRSESAPQIAARGGAEPFASFRSICSGECVKGQKISFDLQGTTGYRYFAAFSKRPDGTALWYFPSSEAATSLDLATQPKNGILDQSIIIDADHPAGTYHVYGVFSREPLTRTGIRDAFDDTLRSAGPNTAVIETELVVR
jgi:hypothetical protein